MIELGLICNICFRKILPHAFTVYCGGCKNRIHKQCATNDDQDFIHAIESKCWLCRPCSEEIFPFNQLENDEYSAVIYELFNDSKSFYINNYQDIVFSPFEINDNDKDFPFGDVDPDSQYFNNIAYQLQTNSNYYNEGSLNAYLDTNNVSVDSFSIAHLNIRSISAHLSEFQACMDDIRHPFSVYAFTETWLNETNQACYGLPGYNHVNVVRQGRTGGGVSLFVSDVLEFNEIHELTGINNVMESVFIEISLCNINIIVGAIYRPPDTDLNVFNAMYDNHVDILKGRSCPCYIVGDYNINLLKYDEHRQTGQFLDSMFANSFVPLINRPTRITQNSATLIDNIFSNNYNINDKLHQGILTTDISDHYLIFHIWEKKIHT